MLRREEADVCRDTKYIVIHPRQLRREQERRRRGISLNAYSMRRYF
jgi:hypothetical protein